MTRTGFASELDHAERSTRELGQTVVDAIGQAMTAVRTQDGALAERVVRHDAAINAKRYAIEEEAVGIIATQEPVARDLRLLVAVLNVIVDLERIADHAAGIAGIVLQLGEPVLELPPGLPGMAELATSMLEGSLAAFFARDPEAARRVAERDDEVDALVKDVYGDLIASMLRQRSSVNRATHLIWLAHDLERIADRATNICERVVYLVTGNTREINVSRA
ncbi:MAG: phosphate signaling complex protein PhoU [Chloroflexi bacterium]|nr:MAG: phosphate signaling complex protein PhoU [Chloroflexota bacterium]